MLSSCEKAFRLSVVVMRNPQRALPCYWTAPLRPDDQQTGDGGPPSKKIALGLQQRQLKNWPERQEWKLAWVSAKKAVGLIEEPGVVPLLLGLTS